MKEFGSDFHYIELDNVKGDLGLLKVAKYYANGRQAIQSLILNQKWKRIWMPEYFCYNIISSIKNTGIEVCYYIDYPTADDIININKIDFKSDDVLFRMNYFGIRKFRSNSSIPVSTIEDHSHDLIGSWASKSDADWCIASLRKTLPIAEGGVLWSPKCQQLPKSILYNEKNNLLSQKRWEAMKLKAQYLQNQHDNKEVFRNIFIETEKEFDNISFANIDEKSYQYIQKFDILRWYEQKRMNWQILDNNIFSSSISVIKSESSDCNMFSYIILFKNRVEREIARKKLIQVDIYPSILWEIPANISNFVKEISDRILSIPCDGRYNVEDMAILISKLKDIL